MELSYLFRFIEIPLIMGTFRRRLLRNASLFLILYISHFPKVVELRASFQFIGTPHIMGTFRRRSAHCIMQDSF